MGRSPAAKPEDAGHIKTEPPFYTYPGLITIHDVTPVSGAIGPHFLLICPPCSKAVKLPKSEHDLNSARTGAQVHNNNVHGGAFAISDPEFKADGTRREA